jgi:hypothetical protein
MWNKLNIFFLDKNMTTKQTIFELTFIFIEIFQIFLKIIVSKANRRPINNSEPNDQWQGATLIFFVYKW